MTSTTAEVKGKKIISTILKIGKTVDKNEQITFMATKNDIKHIVLINVRFL